MNYEDQEFNELEEQPEKRVILNITANSSIDEIYSHLSWLYQTIREENEDVLEGIQSGRIRHGYLGWWYFEFRIDEIEDAVRAGDPTAVGLTKDLLAQVANYPQSTYEDDPDLAKIYEEGIDIEVEEKSKIYEKIYSLQVLEGDDREILKNEWMRNINLLKDKQIFKYSSLMMQYIKTCAGDETETYRNQLADNLITILNLDNEFKYIHETLEFFSANDLSNHTKLADSVVTYIRNFFTINSAAGMNRYTTIHDLFRTARLTKSYFPDIENYLAKIDFETEEVLLSELANVLENEDESHKEEFKRIVRENSGVLNKFDTKITSENLVQVFKELGFSASDTLNQDSMDIIQDTWINYQHHVYTYCEYFLLSGKYREAKTLWDRITLDNFKMNTFIGMVQYLEINNQAESIMELTEEFRNSGVEFNDLYLDMSYASMIDGYLHQKKIDEIPLTIHVRKAIISDDYLAFKFAKQAMLESKDPEKQQLASFIYAGKLRSLSKIGQPRKQAIDILSILMQLKLNGYLLEE